MGELVIPGTVPDQQTDTTTEDGMGQTGTLDSTGHTPKNNYETTETGLVASAQALLDGATPTETNAQVTSATELLEQARTDPETTIRSRGIFALWDKIDQLKGQVLEKTLKVVLGQDRAEELVQKYTQFSQTTTGKLLVMAGQLGVSAGLNALLGPVAMGVFSILAIRRVQKQLVEQDLRTPKDIFSSKESFIAAALGFGQAVALPALTGLVPAGNIISTLLVTAGSTGLSIGTSMAATYGLQRHTMKESRIAMAAATQQSSESLAQARTKLKEDTALYDGEELNLDVALNRLRAMSREEIEPVVRLLLAPGLSERQLNNGLNEFFGKDFQGKYPPRVAQTVQTALEMLEVKVINAKNFAALERAHRLTQTGAANLMRAQTAMMLGSTLGGLTSTALRFIKGEIVAAKTQESSQTKQETDLNQETLNPTKETDLGTFQEEIRAATGDNDAKIIGIEYTEDGKAYALVDFNPGDGLNEADLAFDIYQKTPGGIRSEYGAAIALADGVIGTESFDPDNVVLLDPTSDVSPVIYRNPSDSTTPEIVGATVLTKGSNGADTIHALTTDDFQTKFGISLRWTKNDNLPPILSFYTDAATSQQSPNLGEAISFWTPAGEVKTINGTTLTEKQEWLNINIAEFQKAAAGNPTLQDTLRILQLYDRDGDGLAEIMLKGGVGREWGDVNRTLLQTLIDRGYQGNDLVKAFVTSLERARKMPGILESTSNQESLGTFINNATAGFDRVSSSTPSPLSTISTEGIVKILTNYSTSNTGENTMLTFTPQNIPEISLSELATHRITETSNGTWRLMEGDRDLTDTVIRAYEPDGNNPFAVISSKTNQGVPPVIIATRDGQNAIYTPYLQAGNYEVPKEVANQLGIGTGTLQIPPQGSGAVTFTSIPTTSTVTPISNPMAGSTNKEFPWGFIPGVLLAGGLGLGALYLNAKKGAESTQSSPEQDTSGFPEKIQKFLSNTVSIEQKPLPDEVMEELKKMNEEGLKAFAKKMRLTYPDGETDKAKIARALTNQLIESQRTIESASELLTKTREKLFLSHKKYVEALEEQAKRRFPPQLVNLDPNAHKITISDIHGNVQKAQLSIANAIKALIDSGNIEADQLGGFDPSLDPSDPNNFSAYIGLATKLRNGGKIELIFEGDLVHTEGPESRKRYLDIYAPYDDRSPDAKDPLAITQATIQVQREIASSESVFSFLADMFGQSNKGIYVLLGNHDIMEAGIGKFLPLGRDSMVYNTLGLAINPSDFYALPQNQLAFSLTGNDTSVDLNRFLDLGARQRKSSPLLCTGSAKMFDNTGQEVDIVVTHDMPKSTVIAVALQRIKEGKPLVLNDLIDFVMNRHGYGYEAKEVPEFPASVDKLRDALSLQGSRQLKIVVGHTSRPDNTTIPEKNAEICYTDFQAIPAAFKIYLSTSFRQSQQSQSRTAAPAVVPTPSGRTVTNRWEGTHLQESLPDPSSTRVDIMESYQLNTGQPKTVAGFLTSRVKVEREIKENYPEKLDPRRIDFANTEKVEGWLTTRTATQTQEQEEEHYQSTPTLTALLLWLDTRRKSNDSTGDEKKALMVIMSRIDDIEKALDALPLVASLYDSLGSGLVATNIRRAYQRYLNNDPTIVNQDAVASHRAKRQSARAYWQHLNAKLMSVHSDSEERLSVLTKQEQLDYFVLSATGAQITSADFHRLNIEEAFHDTTKDLLIWLIGGDKWLMQD